MMREVRPDQFTVVGVKELMSPAMSDLMRSLNNAIQVESPHVEEEGLQEEGQRKEGR